MDNDEVDRIVRSYFTVEEWENFPDIYRIRYRNMYRNYVSVPGAEVFMPVPDFMQKKKKTQDSEAKNLDINRNEVGKSKRKTNADTYEDRYPKRGVPKINYHEEPEPNPDRYVFCDNCGREYLDFCEKCGMLVALYDSPVPMGTEDRAKKTVPKGVIEIRRSSIHGLGAFALRTVRKGVQIGPYEGKITRVDTANGYAWKLRNGRLIDASDESNSNWMRYVNCARNVAEQNVVAFQYKGQLYYRSSREIKKGEEILVYYGQSFAKILGIDVNKYFHPIEEEADKDFFPCQHCSVGLGTSDYRDTHELRCRFRPNKMKKYSENDNYVCKYCCYALTTKEYLEKHEKRCSERLKLLSENKRGDEKATEKWFTCRYCPYKSKRKLDVKKHEKILHEKHKAQTFHCEKCKFQTYYKSNFSTHLRLHENNTAYKCHKCSKGFSHRFALDGHILSNHKDLICSIKGKIYHCNSCDYKALTNYNVAIHVNHVHCNSVAEKYTCFTCGYSTVNKSDLTRHIKTHSTLKKFVCYQCKKGFNVKQGLDSHILYNHSDNMKLLETVTSKIHFCQHCSFRTVSITNLNRHIKAHHK